MPVPHATQTCGQNIFGNIERTLQRKYLSLVRQKKNLYITEEAVSKT
jgi:hypothetical protein